MASETHRMASGIDFEDVEGKKKHSPFRIYSESKLSDVFFNRELARRV